MTQAMLAAQVWPVSLSMAPDRAALDSPPAGPYLGQRSAACMPALITTSRFLRTVRCVPRKFDMPIYAYRCNACGHDFDRLQRLSDPDPDSCPACNDGTVQRQLSAPQFRLAGSGWYETDFKKDGDKKRNLADSGGGDAASTAASTGGSAAPATATATSD